MSNLAFERGAWSSSDRLRINAPNVREPARLVESDYEVWQRMVATILAPKHKDPDAIADLSPREAEAVGLYLWGEQMPHVRILWETEQYPTIAVAILAEHPSRSQVARLMRPTEDGTPVQKGNVSRFLKRAAHKFGTDLAGLRLLAIRGLVRAEASKQGYEHRRAS